VILLIVLHILGSLVLIIIQIMVWVLDLIQFQRHSQCPAPAVANALPQYTAFGLLNQAPNAIAAYMATISDLGEASTSSTRYVNFPTYVYHRNLPFINMCSIVVLVLNNAAGKTDVWSTSSPGFGQTEWELATPVFYHRQKKKF
jgi:hypothetical protein